MERQTTRVEAASMDDYTKTIVASCLEMKRKHPGTPLFILGHSMGALIALVVELENPGMFNGLILTGSLIHSAEDTPMNRVLGAVVGRVCPSCSLDALRLDVEEVTRSRRWQQVIRRDPLFHHGGFKFGQGQVVQHCTIRTPLFL